MAVSQEFVRRANAVLQEYLRFLIQTERSEGVVAFLSNHLNKCAHAFRETDRIPKGKRYGMTNGTCPLVFCLQKSCRGFEHSYTFGSINDSDTDRK